MLLQLVNKVGADGVASQGLLVNALRASGQGGAGLPGRHLWPALDKGGVVDSLVASLKELDLRLRVKGCSQGTVPMAAKHENDIEGRTALNNRGIVLESETLQAEETIIRIGQCWLVGGRILEILAYRGSKIEIME